jgi:WD40 repeat protein
MKISWDNTVKLWDVESGTLLWTGWQTGVVNCVTFAPHGHVLASSACVRVQEAHQGTINALKVSPDGTELASCGDDGAIMLWDVQNSVHIQTLRRDRPYERLNITGIRGATEVQKASLRALGAFEEMAMQ